MAQPTKTMKNIVIFSLLLLTISLQSCITDKCTDTREFYQLLPVLMTPSEFRTSEVKTTDAQKLENPGKMSFYKQYLFVNEMGKGVHIYDLSDEQNPTEITFYSIPGNFDVAIKNDIMYADNVIDLIAVDISDVLNPRLIQRIENYQSTYERDQYVAYYNKSDRTTIIDCSDDNFDSRFFDRGGQVFANVETDGGIFSADSNGGPSTVSVNGSFARFTIVGDFLHTVDHRNLLTFDISAGEAALENKKDLGWGIETIFPYKDKLFIGSNSGMYIFDNSTPGSPQLASTFQHARACDPVVVKNDVAYVTLRDGTRCQGFVNQMDVVDVKNIFKPKLIKSYEMLNPHGLSVRGDYAYICEGRHGLKVMDIQDNTDIKQVSFEKDMDSYDVISLSESRLLLIGADGFFFINSSDKGDLKVISSILIDA